MGYSSKLSKEDHKKAQIFARLTYAGIMLMFLSLCAVAVFVTMQQEKNKDGFRAIEVSQPISFIDKTYLKEDAPQQDNN